MRCLHFSKANPFTASVPQSTSRTEKVDEIVNYFNTKMASIYSTAKQLSLDEAMVLWRGRLVFRQYIKSKHHKYGIKLFTLNKPEGLTLTFSVYSEKGALDEVSGKGHQDSSYVFTT